MSEDYPQYPGLTLFSAQGERKYLNFEERKRFLKAVEVLENEKDKTYCLMLFWSGCRPCEALGTKAIQIDLGEDAIVIQSAKKRGKWKGRKYRVVPVPHSFITRLEHVHNIRIAQRQQDGGASERLWTMCRTTAWKRIKTVCNAADVSGIRACGRGLRHGFGTGAAISKVEPSALQSMMGHESYETTSVYLDVLGAEQRAIAARMWAGFGVR